MHITGFENENLILRELGNRLKQYRISLNLTQAELSQKCGISMSTVVRIENGDDTKVSNYIRILSGLDILENINTLIPEESADYKQLFEEKTPRKRVRLKNESNVSDWTWGEDK